MKSDKLIGNIGKTILITVIFAIAISCDGGREKSSKGDKEQKNDTTDSVQNENTDNSSDKLSIEDKILNKVLALPEVKERADYIIKETNGERHLEVWIASTPKETGSYYLIKAGEDNGMSMVTHFDFYVYPKTMEIKYYDILTDSELSLAEWREEKRKF
ncbi:MAG: hypothetical protein PHW83_01020 [Bacteroidales bacterium]|nr:hypothetical protein [Bacteroidales bacterium]